MYAVTWELCCQQSSGKVSTAASTKKIISRPQNLLMGHYFRMNRTGCEMIRLKEGGEVKGVALQPGAQTEVLMRTRMGGCI